MIKITEHVRIKGYEESKRSIKTRNLVKKQCSTGKLWQFQLRYMKFKLGLRNKVSQLQDAEINF